MASLKYSRQREAIKDYLSSVTTHPTADTVYMHIKEEFPNISLGTVYRNCLPTQARQLKLQHPMAAIVLMHVPIRIIISIASAASE